MQHVVLVLLTLPLLSHLTLWVAANQSVMVKDTLSQTNHCSIIHYELLVYYYLLLS